MCPWFLRTQVCSWYLSNKVKGQYNSNMCPSLLRTQVCFWHLNRVNNKLTGQYHLNMCPLFQRTQICMLTISGSKLSSTFFRTFTLLLSTQTCDHNDEDFQDPSQETGYYLQPNDSSTLYKSLYRQRQNRPC